MSIKLLDPAARFEVVCEWDSAIITETAEELESLKVADGPSNPTRYERYMDSLNVSDLRLKDGEKPTLFVIRCITNTEMADLQSKHLVIDTEKKSYKYKNHNQYLLDCFSTGVVGMKDESGKVVKITSDQVDLKTAVSLGSVVTYVTGLGKNLKNA